METEKSSTSVYPFAGFWIRFAAFLIDVVLLSIFGAILSFFFKDYFYEIGEKGWWIGFLVSGLYATLSNGELGQGKTFGKRFLGLQVLTEKGNILSYQRALLRFFIIALVVYNQGIGSMLFGEIRPTQYIEWTTDGYYFLVFLVAIGIFFPMMLHSQKRGFHDLFAKSYVVKEKEFSRNTFEASLLQQFANQKRNKITFITCTLVVLSAISFFLFLDRYFKKKYPEDLQSLLKLADAVKASLKSESVNVNLRYLKGSFGSSTDLLIHVYVPKNVFEDKAQSYNYSNRAGKLALTIYPYIQSVDHVVVALRTGFNIGIFRYSKNYFYQFNAQEVGKETLESKEIPSEMSSPEIEKEASKLFSLAQGLQYKQYTTPESRGQYASDKETMLKAYETIANKYPESQYADEALYWLAFYYDNEKGDKDKALEIYKTAVEQYSGRSKTSITIAHLYRNMATLLKEQSKYADALKVSQDCIKAFKEYINNPANGEEQAQTMSHQMGYILVQQGKIYEEFLGKNKEALSSYQEAEKAFSRHTDDKYAIDAIKKVKYDIQRVSGKLAGIKEGSSPVTAGYSEVAKPEIEAEAFRHFSTAQNMQYQLRNPEGALKEYQIVANKFPQSQYADEALYWTSFFYENDNKEKALNILQQAALKYATRSKTSYAIAHMHRNMGKILTEVGKYKEALNALEKSIKAYEDYINNPANGREGMMMSYQMGHEYINMAQIYEDHFSDYKKALKLYKEAQKAYLAAGFEVASESARKINEQIDRISQKITQK